MTKERRKKVKTHFNRYLLLTFGAIVNFCYGSAYIWTVFQPAAKSKFSLSTASANRPFSVFMGCFVVGNIIGGKLQQRIVARTIIFFASLLMCLGFFFTSAIPQDSAWVIPLTYGCMGGLGAGIAYNTLVATVQKWFPDKRGLVTGIIICTAGAPGLIMTPICNDWIGTFGFSKAMLLVAVLYLFICLGGGWIITNPPAEYMHDYQPIKTVIPSKQYTTSEMLKRTDYYLIAGAMMLAVPAYFLINPMMKSLGLERGLSHTLALTGVMLSSVMNVSGRLVTPWISDLLGRIRILILLFFTSMIAILCLTVAQGTMFIVCIALVSFSYGGFFGIFPLITGDYFGIKYLGMNYGFVMIGYGLASVICPFLTAIGVTFSFIAASVACVTGTILILVLKNRR
jgi:OFA family oxalate/formate antiporter-like MFS transporter